MLMPYAQGITWQETEGVSITPILLPQRPPIPRPISIRAQTVNLEDGDAAGPFDVGVHAEKTLEEGAGAADAVHLGKSVYGQCKHHGGG